MLLPTDKTDLRSASALETLKRSPDTEERTKLIVEYDFWSSGPAGHFKNFYNDMRNYGR
jgi:hypothetical protein